MYHKGISTIATLYKPKRNWKTETELWVGPTETGKSRQVHDRFPLDGSNPAFWKQPDTPWFDTYAGEDCVVLDDFYGTLPWSTLLQLCDRYPMTVQVKGGTLNFAPHHLIITSNRLLHIWYSKLFASNRVAPEAFFRRIDKLYLWDDTTKKYNPHPSPLEYLNAEYATWKYSRENNPELYD